MTEPAGAAAVHADERPGRRAWIIVAFFNALPVLFGSSYIWWPSDDVLRHGGTEGLIHVDRYIWGVFVMLSAGAVLLTALTGLRRGRRWAWIAAWYDIPFFTAVAVIEPDYIFPVLFGIIVAATLVWSRSRFAS